MIKHIIFDLGGVILNLNQDLTLRAFSKLGLDLFEINAKSTVFTDYETGKINCNTFRAILKSFAIKPLTDEQIDVAWNKMLLDLPEFRFDILAKLQQKFDLYLLSNTNLIHIKQVYAYLNQTYPNYNFNSYFKQVYFSHEIGCRKPDAASFLKVINDNQLNPEHTLFIDDSMLNIKGANAVGLKTLLAKTPLDNGIFEMIDDLKSL